MLGRQLGEDTLNDSSLRAIISAAERGSDLTRRLIQLGEFPIDTPERGDLVAAIRRNQVLLKPILGSGAEIQLNLPAREIYVPLCEEGMTQILIGCVLDARARYAGRISISVSVAQRNAMLHFSDNGIDVQGRMVSEMSTEWQMVNEWVRNGDGKMDAVLQPHSGGDVMVSFPLAIQSANPFADKTVLVMDDGAGLPDLMEAHLHPLGVRVLRAANAEQALVMQRTHPSVDVLFTQVAMPELNGVTLAGMMVTDNPALQVVYLTNESDPVPDGMAQGLAKSAITLPQPLSLRKLSASLERALQSVQNMGDSKAP